jgi:hypothetical protein
MIIKHIGDIDVGPILNSFFELDKDIKWSMNIQGKQTGLQYRPGEDPWTSAVGKSTGGETQYTELNPFFKNTIFENIINEYDLKRTRLMWVFPKSCYSLHQDETPRIHIPLITNPECYFLFNPGLLRQLDINSVWWVNTKLKHTFLNCSEEPRLHLVGIVEN